MTDIKRLLNRASDYWEAIWFDGFPTKEDERLAIEWQELNGCRVAYDDGKYKVWEDCTDGWNFVVKTPYGLLWAAREKEESNA